jgi:phosphopantothenoylcysteine decarboxylase/phosphopantothenate--cysteine ligase
MIAPSMNKQMYASLAMKENLQLLKGRNVIIIEPGFGEQACGDVGEGRLAEPIDIAQLIFLLQHHHRPARQNLAL